MEISEETDTHQDAVHAEAVKANVPSTGPVDPKVPIDLGVGILKGEPNELQVSTAEQFSDALSNAVQKHVRISRVHQIVPMTRMDGALVGRQSIPRDAKTKYAAR
jgi:hypothetical protein